MTPTPTKSVMRWQFFGVMLMCVALGVLILTAFDNWLRGNSIVWWLLLVVIFVFAISANSMAILKRIT
jgi:hypothetical protein